MVTVRRASVGAWVACLALLAVPGVGSAQQFGVKPQPDARFGNWLFKTPDPSVWTRQEKDGHLLFVAGGGGRGEYCVLTLYPGGDAEGGFRQQFMQAVGEKLKNRNVTRTIADSGALPHKAEEGFDVLTRTVRGQTKRGEVDHVYVAGHSGDRFDMAAFQASSPALWQQHEAEATQFLTSLKLVNSMSPDQVDRVLGVQRQQPAYTQTTPYTPTPPATPATYTPTTPYVPTTPYTPTPPSTPPDATAGTDPLPSDAPKPDSKFGNWLFKTPAMATWRRVERDQHLLFLADAGGKGQYCAMTLFPGDAAEGPFKQQFADAVGRHLKTRKVFRVIADTGALPHNAGAGWDVLVRVVRGQTADGEVDHLYAAVRSKDRFELAAFQASSPALWQAHKDEAVRFMQSLRAINALTPAQVDQLLN